MFERALHKGVEFGLVVQPQQARLVGHVVVDGLGKGLGLWKTMPTQPDQTL